MSDISFVNTGNPIEAGRQLVRVPSSSSDAVLRRLTDKLLEIVSVKDFGAIGDNSTDDTTAIQDAIDFCETNGLLLYLPPATYRTTSTVTILSCSIIAWGAEIRADVTVTDVIQIGDASNIYQGHIAGLHARGQGQSTSPSHPSGAAAWKFVNASQAKFDFIEGSNIERAMHVVPQDGTRVAYCVWLHPYMHRCNYHAFIYVDTTTGFAAENTVIGGRFQTTGTLQNHIYAEKTSGSGSINHWKWYGVSMESTYSSPAIAATAVRLKRCQYWLIDQPRTEGDWGTADIRLDANCADNLIINNYQDGSFSVEDVGSNNRVIYHERTMVSGVPCYFQRGSVTEVTPHSSAVGIFHRDGAARIYCVAGTGSSSSYALGDESDANQAEFILGSGPAGIISIDGTNVLEVRDGVVRPFADNTHDLGDASKRWGEVFAATGSINTSDVREKVWRGELDESEQRVAMTLSRFVGVYQWKEAIAKKGDQARLHVGVTAQNVIAAFEAEGLDPYRYAVVCFDEWDDQWDHNADGEEYLRTPAGNRYGIRYDELAQWQMVGLSLRLDKAGI